jgi:hypothetical protein
MRVYSLLLCVKLCLKMVCKMILPYLVKRSASIIINGYAALFS